MIKTEQIETSSESLNAGVNNPGPATLLEQHEERAEEIQAAAELKQEKASVEKGQADPLLNQQQVTVEKKEQKGFRLIVKNYFAEVFLASMYLLGMFLAVMYMLAHTWR